MATTPTSELLSPIQRDVLVLLGGMALLLLAVGIAVGFGLSFGPATGGFAPWAVGLLFLAVLGFGASVVWWYYIYDDEREPARGEFTHHRGEGMQVHEGMGSFRDKPLYANAAEEPNARMESSGGYVPRTQRSWFAWFGATTIAFLIGAGLIALSSRVQGDPFALQMAAVAIIGFALVLGAAGMGEFGHWGAWTRDRRRAGP